ncbi:unnamed protein product [Fraxinus pennsylvanica]|uniref:DUF3700 domain-containing protein n=1 Tax=Fraxinus pennsylvanica TaxID=56036 RepID=A0AAD1YV45_9LAMI|nr:unnamed protein product [Fraxinus pennsylvanica]
MLAIFKNGLVNPPKELNSPSSFDACGRIKSTEDTSKVFLASHPTNGFSIRFVDKALLAYAPPQKPIIANQKLCRSVNDINCISRGVKTSRPNLTSNMGYQKVEMMACLWLKLIGPSVIRAQSLPIKSFKILKVVLDL